MQAGLPLLVQMVPQAVRREQVLLLLTPLRLVDLRVAREWAGRAAGMGRSAGGDLSSDVVAASD